MSQPASRCQRTTASLSVRFQVDIASAGSAGQLDVAQALGDAHVVGVHHPGHAVAHRAQVVDLGVDERARVERPAVARRVRARG